VPSLISTILVFQPLSAQYFVYILNKSPAKILASSPPVPALISTITFLASSGSFGININLMSSSNCGKRASASSISILAISVISSSDPSAIISLASSIFFNNPLYSSPTFITAFKSLYSLLIFT